MDKLGHEGWQAGPFPDPQLIDCFDRRVEDKEKAEGFIASSRERRDHQISHGIDNSRYSAKKCTNGLGSFSGLQALAKG